jgi:hypothetical protein
MVKLYAPIHQEPNERFRSPFNPPSDPNQRLWRYLSLDKLPHMLRDRALYMRRVDSFADPLEGQPSKATEIAWDLLFIERDILHAHRDEVRRWQRADRLLTYASCWRMDDSESMRAWREYCPFSRSVAVRTTYTRLMDSVGHLENGSPYNKWNVGTVFYFDRLSEGYPTHNAFLPFMFKDQSYAWERELRVLMHLQSRMDEVVELLELEKSGDITPIHMNLPLDPILLIEEIVCHPESEASFPEEVVKLIRQAGLSIPCVRSKLTSIGNRAV